MLVLVNLSTTWRGYSERCFIHIRDAMQGTLRLALEAEPGTSWHLSANNPLKIRDLVDTIFRFCGKNFSDIVEESPDRLGKDQSYLLDSSSIRKAFSWTDKHLKMGSKKL